jgi:hypothetical protein
MLTAACRIALRHCFEGDVAAAARAAAAVDATTIATASRAR